MAEARGGARLDLAQAPLKYAGLAPWEILRLRGPGAHDAGGAAGARSTRFLELAPAPRGRGHRARRVHRRRLSPRDATASETVACSSMEFLHDGLPGAGPRRRAGRRRASTSRRRAAGATSAASLLDAAGAAEPVLAARRKARHYDHEVKGLTVVKPFVGVDARRARRGHGLPGPPRLAARLRALRGRQPVLLRHRHPRDGAGGRRRGGAPAALRRRAARPHRAARQLLLARSGRSRRRRRTAPTSWRSWCAPAAACTSAAAAYGTPLISGKDSMKNDSTMGGVKISVPPTLLVSAIGQIDDVRRRGHARASSRPATSSSCSATTRDETGGSEYFRYLGERDGRRAALGAAAALRRQQGAAARPGADAAALPRPRRRDPRRAWSARRPPRPRAAGAWPWRAARWPASSASTSTWTPAPALDGARRRRRAVLRVQRPLPGHRRRRTTPTRFARALRRAAPAAASAAVTAEPRLRRAPAATRLARPRASRRSKRRFKETLADD